MIGRKHETTHHKIAPYFEDNYNQIPHCLLELGTRDSARIKDNTIHLSGKVITQYGKSKDVLYNDVNYGSNAKVLK